MGQAELCPSAPTSSLRRTAIGVDRTLTGGSVTSAVFGQSLPCPLLASMAALGLAHQRPWHLRDASCPPGVSDTATQESEMLC